MLTITLICFPMLMAAAIMVMGAKHARNIALGTAVAELLFALWAWWLHKSGDTVLLSFNEPWLRAAGVSLSFMLDGISLVLVLLATISAPLIIYSSFNKTYRNAHVFYGLGLAMVGGMIGAFTANDGLIFYLFYELSLIPVYFMILIWGGGEHKARVTLKFFLYTLFGSLFMLVSLLYVYQHTANGSFAFADLYQAGRSLSAAEQGFVFGGIFLAFAVKMPVFPFHTWQPATYNAGPNMATMLLAAIMLKMATYGLIRLIIPMVPAGVDEYRNWAIGLSVFSILYSSCMALVQRNYKLLIAYSSIAHIGMISAGILSGNAEGIQGGLMEMLSHGIIAIGLFFVYDILVSRLGHDQIKNMGGIRGSNPQFAFLFFALVMGSVALPLTSGFVGEFLLLTGIAQHHIVYAAAAGLTVVLGVVYMLRAFQAMMLGPLNNSTQNFAALTAHEKTILVLVVLLIAAFGIYPKPILELGEGVSLMLQ